jgi:hypothetical protein
VLFFCVCVSVCVSPPCSVADLVILSRDHRSALSGRRRKMQFLSGEGEAHSACAHAAEKEEGGEEGW